MKKLLMTFLFCCVIFSGFSLGTFPIEEEFNDAAGLLLFDEEKEIVKMLEKINNDSKEMQVAFLTIPSLDDEKIEDYARDAIKNWKLDKKGVEQGVLLLVAEKENAAHIWVGDKLKAKLTSNICSKIVNKMIIPYLNDSKHYEGIKAGLSAIVAYESGDEKKIKNLEAKTKKELKAWNLSKKQWIYIILGALPILSSLIGSIKTRNFRWPMTLIRSLLGRGSYNMGGVNPTDLFSGGNNSFGNNMMGGNMPPNNGQFNNDQYNGGANMGNVPPGYNPNGQYNMGNVPPNNNNTTANNTQYNAGSGNNAPQGNSFSSGNDEKSNNKGGSGN